MLWKKESSRRNSLYVDIMNGNSMPAFASIIYRNLDNRSTLKKNDATSFNKRQEGKKLFGEREYTAAIEKYNESLCYAEPTSQNISLAYANRSNCFLKLKMFNECLVDIQLAKEARYPQHLMQKLDLREAECLKHIEELVESDDIGALSFEADDQFPCMANVLKMDRDVSGNFSVFAKEDIAVGKTVVVEKGFLAYQHKRFGVKCNICLKGNCNLMPCQRCNVAMFCSDECKGSFLHEYECGLKFCDDSSADQNMNGFVLADVRCLLLAVNMFASVDEMIDFVEHTLRNDQQEPPGTLMDAKSKYRMYLKLPTFQDFRELKDVVLSISCVQKCFLSIPAINKMFNSLKHQRFLMHLIGHHTLITNYNANRLRIQLPIGNIEVTSVIFLVSKYFGHSCAPNLVWSMRNDTLVYTTIRPIKKDEILFISMFSFLMSPVEVRQHVMLVERHRICECPRCKGITASRAQKKQLSSDPDYKYIVSHKSAYQTPNSTVLDEKCVTFLQKYGEVPWCDEIGAVVNVYTDRLHFRLSNAL